MPHLVDRDDDLLRRDGGIGEFVRFVANPVQDGDVADPENPRYRRVCAPPSSKVGHVEELNRFLEFYRSIREVC